MSRAVTLCRGLPPPQAFAKCERVMPSSRARWFIKATKASSDPGDGPRPERSRRRCPRRRRDRAADRRRGLASRPAANMLEPPGFGVALARRARRDRRGIVEPEPAFDDGAKDDLGGEDLGRRRRRHRRVGVLGERASRRCRSRPATHRGRSSAAARRARAQRPASGRQQSQRDEDGVTEHVEAQDVWVA